METLLYNSFLNFLFSLAYLFFFHAYSSLILHRVSHLPVRVLEACYIKSFGSSEVLFLFLTLHENIVKRGEWKTP